MTRDGFDFLFLYLYETDAAQHRGGDAIGAVEQADASLGLLVEAAGGWDQFLERYAVMVVADHSQSAVERAVDAQEPLEGLKLFRSSRHSDPAECDLAVAASNRVAMASSLERMRRLSLLALLAACGNDAKTTTDAAKPIDTKEIEPSTLSAHPPMSLGACPRGGRPRGATWRSRSRATRGSPSP